MAKRISHSLLDPYLMPPIKGLYKHLPIPTTFPPEGIIAIGHILAIIGAVGFSYSTTRWWGGLLVAIGVAGNHIADCLDGTHARSTDQCRNGGELLDHFVDPLSFSYWLCGIAFAVGHLEMGLAAVICLYAMAVLTNIKAKMVDEFTLASFGPTEFKSLLVLMGLVLSFLASLGRTQVATNLLFWFFAILLVVGFVQLILGLYQTVREVNQLEATDKADWDIRKAVEADSSNSTEQSN